MANGNGSDIDELGKVALEGNVVFVLCNDVEWTVPLGVLENLPPSLYTISTDCFERPRMLPLDAGSLEHLPDRLLRVVLGYVEIGSPYRGNISMGWTLDFDLEPRAALNTEDLAWFHVQMSELSLEVDCALLQND